MRSLVCPYQTDEDVEWTDIKRHALGAIAKFFESGDPITIGAVHHESSEYATCPSQPSDLTEHCVNLFTLYIYFTVGLSEDDDDIVSMIKELLDNRIRYKTNNFQSNLAICYGNYISYCLYFVF